MQTGVCRARRMCWSGRPAVAVQRSAALLFGGPLGIGRRRIGGLTYRAENGQPGLVRAHNRRVFSRGGSYAVVGESAFARYANDDAGVRWTHPGPAFRASCPMIRPPLSRAKLAFCVATRMLAAALWPPRAPKMCSSKSAERVPNRVVGSSVTAVGASVL